MSNFRLKNPDAVFIHIPKTGSTSIRRGVWINDHDGPNFGLIPVEWGLFRFAFVRRPYDRLISAWRMFSRSTIYEKRSALKSPQLGPCRLSSSRYCYKREYSLDIFSGTKRILDIRIRHHAIPQTHAHNGLHMADYVGGYETIEQDFLVLAKRIGVERPLPHLLRAIRTDWPAYMDAEDIDLYCQFFPRNFEELGYGLD